MGPLILIRIPALLIGLSGLLTWFIGYGLRSIGVALTKATINIVKGAATPQKLLFKAVDTLSRAFGISSHKAETDVGDVAREFESSTAGYIGHKAAQTEYSAFTLPIMMGSVYGGLTGMRDVALPKTVDKRTKTTREHASGAEARARQAGRSAAGAAAGALIGTRIATRAHGEAKVAQGQALAAATAGAAVLPWDHPWTRAKEQSTASERAHAKWLRRVLAIVGAGVFTGAVVSVLVRRLPWFQCSNVNTMARALCRMPRNRFDGLLAFLTDFLILTNICRIIPLLSEAFDLIAAPMINQLAVVGAQACNAQFDTPPSLVVPELHGPRLQSLAAGFPV